MQAQQETWDMPNDFVDVVYYHGGLRLSEFVRRPDSIELEVGCSDEYYMMHYKFKLCLDHIEEEFGTYDFIFRTNSSSYINKERLLKHAETLPKEKCYAGWSLGEKEAVSGAGIWLSPDMVSILRDEVTAGVNIEEDILIGRILHGKHGIEIIDDKSRVDVTDPDLAPIDFYHYRFKTSDRLQDIRNMYQLHQMVKK
jgi:hypothetical protein